MNGIDSKTRLISQQAESDGKNTTVGDSQHSRYYLHGMTITATPTGLLMGAGALAITGILLQPKSTLSFNILVSAYATGLNGGGSGGGWIIEGAVMRTGTVATAGSVVLLGTPRWAPYVGAGIAVANPSFGAGVTIDSRNSLLKIMVTGLTSPVNWQATVLASEVAIIP